jgi:DNA-binding HxlR family transcriptional regulator
MVRNFDLIRSILLQTEQAPSGQPLMQLQADEEIKEEVLAEHLELMIEEGLIEAEVISGAPLSFMIQRLTWKGHDFLENARNHTIWNRVIGEIKSRGLSMTISVVEGLLAKAAQNAAGLP